MRLVRNTTPDGTCKYALVRLDKIRKAGLNMGPTKLNKVESALSTLQEAGFLEYAGLFDPEEAFVIKLKDSNAAPALHAYSETAMQSDPELAKDVAELAIRSSARPDLKNPT